MMNNGLQRKDTVRHGPAASGSEGFTLIELSIALLIISLMIVPLVQIYSQYLYNQKVVKTKDNLASISRALALSSPIRYPCPSDRSLTPADANYGVDICSIAGFTLGGVPTCNTSGQEQGFCKAAGTRDTADDTDLTVGNNNEFVLVGGAPFKIGANAIGGLNGAAVRDGWGNQFSYAVSYTSSRPNRTEGFTRFKNGVIRVLDEWGNDTVGSDRDAHFLVYSHGVDGLGSFNNTSLRRDCVVANVDGENCDGDGTFVQGISHFEGTIKYDDYSYVQTDSSANLWQIVTDPANSNAPTEHILTIPTGKLGVNSDTPGTSPPTGVDVRLDVAGDIRADTIRTNEICKKDGTNCLGMGSGGFFEDQKTSVTSGVKNDCGDGEVISNISSQQVSCSKAAITFTGAQVLCPLGAWVEQILTNGQIKCSGGIVCPGGPGCL